MRKLDKHKYSTNPIIEITQYPGSIRLEFWTGRIRKDLTTLVFKKSNRQWFNNYAPGEHERVKPAAIKELLHSCGSYSLQVIACADSKQVTRVDRYVDKVSA
jgi:hypothetical protein